MIYKKSLLNEYLALTSTPLNRALVGEHLHINKIEIKLEQREDISN